MGQTPEFRSVPSSPESPRLRWASPSSAFVSHRRSPSASLSIRGGSYTPRWRPEKDLQSPAHPQVRFAEAAGGTAASCAAICCCCPCGAFNLLVALVKLPAGLARRALRRRRMRMLRRLAAGGRKKKAGVSYDDDELSIHRGYLLPKEEDPWPAKPKPAAELSEFLALEREMLAKFYSAGFWRSPSQREDPRL